MRVGTDLKPGTKVLKFFSGVDPEGRGAAVQRTANADYAQYDDLRHPKAYGWWRHPRGTFREKRNDN